MDNQKKSYLIFFGWVAFVVFLGFYWGKLVEQSLGNNLFLNTLLYFFTNPAYLLLIYYIVKYTPISKVKSSIFSIILVVAMDIVSSPRILVNELRSQSMSFDLGSVMVNYISQITSPTSAWFLTYVLIPICLFFIAMEGLGYIDFVKKIKGVQ